MKCARCGRTINVPAARVTTRAGSAGYGPRCAQLMGLLRVSTKRTPRAKSCEGQGVLFEGGL